MSGAGNPIPLDGIHNASNVDFFNSISAWPTFRSKGWVLMPWLSVVDKLE